MPNHLLLLHCSRTGHVAEFQHRKGQQSDAQISTKRQTSGSDKSQSGSDDDFDIAEWILGIAFGDGENTSACTGS